MIRKVVTYTDDMGDLYAVTYETDSPELEALLSDLDFACRRYIVATVESQPGCDFSIELDYS